MSYIRQYTKHIVKEYKGYVEDYITVKYDASQSGGEKTVRVRLPYKGEVEEDVQVNIKVDTTPFDQSVKSCAKHVDVLTGTVVATETAQVDSIQAKAKQIGDTVVDGFFNTVRFEITTQIVELKKRVEALLLDINEKQKKLLALKSQMEKDYQRTSERYNNVFSELNQELDNRVHTLDQPIFSAATEIYRAEDRFMESDMLNVIALTGKENAILEAQISTAIAKKHAQAALNEANSFIAKKQATETTLKHCTLNDNREFKYFAPICCASLVDQNNVVYSQAYASEVLPTEVEKVVSEHLDYQSIPEMTEEEKENVSVYFNNLINESAANDAHSTRVKNLISKLYSM